MGAQTTSIRFRWPEGAVVYQVYPRSFYDTDGDGIGDIPGITEKLGYIKGLGVNAIWLSPFYPSPMADFGYDVADYCDVDGIFGSLADMDTLIGRAHKKDIRIIVDMVPNHSSDEHEWFRQSRQSREGKYSDWYIWKDPKGHDADGRPIPPNNWINVLTADSAWEWEPARQQFYLHSFHIRQPDLNWENPEVREAIKDAMRFWLDRGVDGFRVDAVPFMAKDKRYRDEPVNPHYVESRGDWKYIALEHIYSCGQPHLYEYLAEMASVLKEKNYAGSERFMVTEGYPVTGNPIKEYLAYYAGMDPEVAAPFNFAGFSLPWKAGEWREFLGAFHSQLNDFDPRCVPSYAFGNHDQYRLATRLGDAAARSAAVLLYTLPGMAFVYNGDELGMKNVEIPPDMIQDPQFAGGFGRDPVRTPMQWSDAKNAGFSTAHQTWLPIAKDYRTHNIETESKDPDSFYSLYRKLGRLRNASASIKHGSFQIVESGDPEVLRFTRTSGKEKHTVFINFSNSRRTFSVEQTGEDPLGKFVLSSDPQTKLRLLRDGKVHMHPHEAVVFAG